MAKQLNVNVAVTADTSAAKAQLQSLQSTLSQLSTSSTNLHLGLNTSELNKAISDVDKLQAHLKNATNSSGLLDFSKLNNSIKASGSSLTEYGNQLLKLGPQGQQAFNQLTQAIAKSEVPMSRMKGLLGEFGTVLGNTIKWQAASSAIHGMMGSIQHAFSYAQQLNKSLNNIQIVTQATDEHMARFAENANKAAKQLNTTTTQYTNASLIYYQQGLNDKQVAERAAATIKMANASGQSAEKVSNQMTAIWNNFDNGTKSLEYYADVITALGAATASSSEEIATGLQKFASVADTVGLSYENATAALATITAQTRQSADSVGTGLRTLFARLQSLNLGETLDDGVTLSKYSKALDTIGVKVIDMSGNLRKADDILMDMGNKWQELSSAQKAAVAQTVGGVRQYTTIMALMDNFDEYLENVKIATNSEGTVQAQADIYAKSWEAAQKRVKAAAESIYSDLIDDKFFISLNNGFANFLDILDQIIDGLGGLRTLIPMIGAALTAAFSDKMTMGLVNVGNTLRSFAPGAARRDRAERDAFLDNAIKIQTGYSKKDYANLSVDQRQQYDYAKRDLEIQRTYAKNSPYMTNLDRMVAQAAMDKYSNLRNAYTQTTSSLSTSQFNQAQARIDMTGFKGTPFDIYTKRNQMGEAGKTALRQAQQYYNMAANNPNSPNGPKYFTDTILDANGKVINPNKTWFSNNGQFQKSTYDKMLQNSKDVETLTTGINDLDNQARILKQWEQAGDQGSKKALEKLNATSFNQSRLSSFYDANTGKITDFDALRQEISSLTEEQDKMVTDFAAKWGKSRESVMKYKDAIVATNGDIDKQKILKEQMEQADKEAEQATKKNQQVQRAQNIVKYAQAMQSAVAAGSSFAAVTENIKTNLENGGSILDNFGSTLSGVTSGFMSMAMTMAAIPGPAGIILAVLSAIIGVASQIPEVTDFIHGLFTSEDQLAVEEAEKAAKQIQEDFEEAKQKAAEFLDATGTHNGLVEQINQCIRGTEEFKQAVIEANMYAKQMMQDYSLSLNDFERNKDGALVLKAGVAESRQAALEAQRDNLEIMNAYSQYEVQRTKYQKAENKISSILNEDTFGVYHEGTKDDHHGGWDAINVSDFLNEYIESGSNLSFEEYYKDRGGSGIASSYRQLNKQVKNLGYTSIDEYIEAGKQYGSASSLKFDGIVSELFNNIATSQVFNKDKDLNISSFLSDYLGTSENGELIRDATLQDWTRNHLGAFSKVREAAGIKSINISDAETFTNLYNNVDFLRRFLEIAGNFDAADLANMNLDQLQVRANSFISAQKGLEIFEKNYETLANDAGVKLLAKTGGKKQSEQQRIAEAAQISLQRYDEIGEENLSDEQKLLRDYYQNWLTQFQEAKDTMVQNAIDLFAEDEFYKINETDTNEQKANKEQVQKKLKDDLTATILNSSLTDEEVANALNLGRQIKNVLRDAFEPQQFADFFNESKSQLTELYQSIDWTSQVSAFFDVARIRERIGNSGTEIANEINSLYEILLDENHLNGKSGLFSQIFQEEDFQKKLKDVQKEFKKTGKVSSDNIKDIAKQCTNLDEAIENNIFSTEALADAMELYSMGAIQSVDEITNALWDALEQANGLEKALSTAFKHIDEWNPDRSVTDIDKHYANVSKDYFNELQNGTTGSNRLYQDAAELFNQNYADNLRTFFYNQERNGSRHEDNPQARYYDYKNNFEAFDTMMQQVQSTGDLSKYFTFMMNGQNQAKISEYMGIDNAKEALEKIGFSMGNAGDVELNTEGKTTNGLIQSLMSALNLNEEQASMIVSEYAGHSSAVSADLQTNDFISGLWQLAGKNGEIDFNNDQVKNYMTARGNNLSADLMMQSLATQYGYGDIIENGGTQKDVLDAFAAAIEAAGDTELGQQLKVQAEAYRQQSKALEELQKVQEQQKKIKDEVSGHGAYEKGKDGKYEGASEEVNTAINKAVEQNRIEGGVKNSTGESIKAVSDQAIEDLQALGMTGENAFKTITNGNDALVHSFTDHFGNIHDILIEGAKDYQDYQEKIQQAEKELAPEANKLFGKQLFEGITEGIRELIQSGEDLEGFDKILEPLQGLNNLDAANISGVAEGLQAIISAIQSGDITNLESLIGKLQELIDIGDIKTKVKITIDPPLTDLDHLRDDFKDIQSMASVQVNVKFGDENGIDKIKENKVLIASLAEGSNIQVHLLAPAEAEIAEIQKLVDKINEMNPELKVTIKRVDENGGKEESKYSQTSQKTVQYKTEVQNVNVKASATVTDVDTSGVEPVPVESEANIEGIDEDTSIEVTAEPNTENLDAALAEPGEKETILNKQSEEIDDYLAAHGKKIVDLYVGKNEPAEAIAALPTSHALAITVSVSVSGANGFGASTNFSGGGEVLGSTLGNEIDRLATHYATSHPRMQAFIRETQLHYQKKLDGTGYGKKAKTRAVGGQIYKSYVNGSVNRYARAGISLTAEEGPEIVWNKQQGYAYIVGGEGHPEFAYLQPGDRIFNANDTRQILNYNRPKSNHSSEVKDPREMNDALFSSHASGYNSYGPQSTYRSSRGKSFFDPERYHLLTRQIEDLTFQYNELKKARERAYGNARLKAIDEEIAKIDELKEHNQSLLEEAENYLEEDLTLLNELGIEYKLDSEGNLENFEELQDQYKKLLELEENANGEKISDEQLDEIQERWNAIEKYEETLDKIREIKEEISDLSYAAADLELERQFFDPERYHLLTRQIEDLTFQYNELKKARERAYGTNTLKAIDAEIAKIDKLKEHNQLLLEEAENYLKEDLALLDKLGIEYELDSEGNLANFEELQDQYKRLLELSKDVNGEPISDEQLDNLQERWNAIEKYEETLDKVRDIKEEISDLKYEAADLAFEKIELKFNMKFDFTDRQLSLIDHFLEKLKGNTADAAEMLAVASQKMDILAQNAQTATEAINSAFVDSQGNQLMVTDDTTGEQRNMTYQDFLGMTPEERTALDISEDAGAMIESSMDQVQQCLEDLEELKTVGLETVSQAIEELTANVEKQIQVFDHYSNMLSALRNITDLQGIKITKELRQTLKQIDESMIQVSKDRITAEKEKYDGLSKMAEDLRKKVQQYTGVDEDLRKGYQEQLDNIESQMRESMETVLSMYANALQTAQDMFETTMDEIKEDYNASLSDIYNTTQLMQEAFDRKTAISEQYVDEYESYYKLNKLQRQINKDIDNQMANGNKANKNLKKLLNEIQKLQEDGIQLTAYDLKLLEKKYEYEKALADLEDARNAKQTIRLQRDRNGNWGYVYTAADETDLEEYQQAIEDKLYEYTQTATQQAKDLEKELLSIWVETGEKIAQLRMEGAPSSAINDLIDDTQKRADFLTESLKKAGEDINYVLPNWIDLTQNEQFNLSLDDFKETVLSYVTGIEDVEAVSQKMMKAIINIAKETKMAVDTYNASIEEINAFVSGGTGDFNASAQTWAAQITKASQENVEKTKEAVNDMVDTFRDVLKEASAFENKFFNEIKPFIQQQEQILIQLTDAMSQLNGLPSNLQNLQDAAALANGQAKATSYIDENGHTQTQITYLDEGGYTGEWGPGGKLAVLHEKENVFNKYDTINLLKAANILRTLDIQTGNFERGLGEFFNPSVKDNKQIFEQEVYITAEFPNATNHSEIEEAFNNLANRATQYANRKVG